MMMMMMMIMIMMMMMMMMVLSLMLMMKMMMLMLLILMMLMMHQEQLHNDSVFNSLTVRFFLGITHQERWWYLPIAQTSILYTCLCVGQPSYKEEDSTLFNHTLQSVVLEEQTWILLPTRLLKVLGFGGFFGAGGGGGGCPALGFWGGAGKPPPFAFAAALM